MSDKNTARSLPHAQTTSVLNNPTTVIAMCDTVAVTQYGTATMPYKQSIPGWLLCVHILQIVAHLSRPTLKLSDSLMLIP